MARRRSKTFGSSASVHRADGREHVRAMKFWIREARKSVASGNCGAAFKALNTAQRMGGALAMDRRGEAGGKMGRRGVFPMGALNASAARFASKCVR